MKTLIRLMLQEKMKTTLKKMMKMMKKRLMVPFQEWKNLRKLLVVKDYTLSQQLFMTGMLLGLCLRIRKLKENWKNYV